MMHKKLLPFTALSFALVAWSAPALNADEIWTKGVSKKSGWVDVDKNWKNDKFLCWAAAASNIIEWWQRRADASALPENAPKGVEVVFEKFRTAFCDRGLGTNIAWKWYFGGCDLVHYNYERDFRDKATARTSGRFWDAYVREHCGAEADPALDPSWIPSGMITETPQTPMQAENLAGTLRKLFENGCGISLALVSGGKWPGGHAITLWGMEYEGDRIKAIYVTDSDDRVRKLQRYKVYYKEIEHRREQDESGKVQQEAWSETRIYLRKYHGSDFYALSSYGALALPLPRGK